MSKLFKNNVRDPGHETLSTPRIYCKFYVYFCFVLVLFLRATKISLKTDRLLILNKLPHPTQLNQKLGKPYFPKKTTKPQTQNHKPKPSDTFSQLLHTCINPICESIDSKYDPLSSHSLCS